MKNNLKLLLIIILFSPFMVNAASVSLDCPSIVKAGSELTCSIKINSSDKVVGVEANISVSNGLTYKNYTKAEGWSGSSSSSTFLIYGGEVSGEKTLGTYTYTVSSSASGNLTVTLSNVIVSDTNGNRLSSNSTTSDIIKVASTVNTLSSLSISGATIEFSPNVTTYNVTINSEKTTISASATDSYAKINGTGNKNLKYGANKFDIVVTSEAGTTKIYTINVTRPDNRNSDNTLKELKLSNATISFKSNITSYSVTIDASETTINAVANNSKSKIMGTGTKKLNYGSNKFEIIVTAENGNTKKYTIDVIRPDKRSINNYLKSLTLSKGNISFDKNKTNYEISVQNDVNEIRINGEAEDKKSKVEGLGTKTLQIGKNTFTIKVIAENESTKEYKIVVIRKGVTTNSDNIKNITVAGYDINFNKNKKDYVIETDKTSLDIKVELESDNSTYEIIGNEDLHDGSIVQIVVTDIDGDNTVYTILIEMPSKNENEDLKNAKSLLMIMIAILAMLIIGNIYLLIKQVLRKKNNIN